VGRSRLPATCIDLRDFTKAYDMNRRSAGVVVSDEKRAAGAGGSKSKQGGVKQSGQEPLNVQKMDGRVIIVKA
jgi:hypothetical protein